MSATTTQEIDNVTQTSRTTMTPAERRDMSGQPRKSAADPTLQQEFWDKVWGAVDGLDDKYRTAFILRDVEGLSTEDAATALGGPQVTPASCPDRVARAPHDVFRGRRQGPARARPGSVRGNRWAEAPALPQVDGDGDKTDPRDLLA